VASSAAEGTVAAEEGGVADAEDGIASVADTASLSAAGMVDAMHICGQKCCKRGAVTLRQLLVTECIPSKARALVSKVSPQTRNFT